MTRIVTLQKSLAALTASWRQRGRSVGFVPTMGALHAGHASLISRARRDNDKVVVSVFVNPKQFGPGEDLGSYPRNFPADRDLCGKLRVDAIFHPPVTEIYPPGFATKVSVGGLSTRLCGKFRPIHFDGVTTIVARLFETVGACRAYFGEKDFQQLVIIRKMAADLGMPVRIVGCATIREPDGLALSSRNRYLSPGERASAALFPQALRWGARCKASRPRLLLAGVRSRIMRIPRVKIDYVELVDPVSLETARRVRRGLRLVAAIHVGRTRLIDNTPLA